MDTYTHSWSAIISSSVVPVVIISACGLLCLAFYNRLAIVVTRLRSLQRERIKEYKHLLELKDKEQKQDTEQFLHFLEDQTYDVLNRARYLRNCIFCMIVAIFSLILSSLTIGLSLFFPFIDFLVIIFFVAGLGLLLVGLIYAVKEIKIALNPIKMESSFVQRLIRVKL